VIDLFFTKNQQQWQAKPLDPSSIDTFRSHAARLHFTQIVAHDSYLINLAATDEFLYQKSIAAFTEEIRRCDQLGIAYLVTHPGAHVGAGDTVGIRRVIDALNKILADLPDSTTTICLETTAGQGTSLGWRFEQLAEMRAGLRTPQRVGICVDTCHILAAGYDITTVPGTHRVLEEFDRVIGLQHLKVFHLNDSKKELGTRVDRHDHIGRGRVGLSAFEVICRHPQFTNIPKILETAKDPAPDGQPWDQHNLKVLRTLAAGKKPRLPAFKAP